MVSRKAQTDLADALQVAHYSGVDSFRAAALVLGLVVFMPNFVSAEAPANTVTPPRDEAAAPTIPLATLDDTLEISGDDLAASEKGSRLFIEVQIDGRGPYRFLVDSGADRSVVGLGVADQLHLPPGSTAKLQGMAGSSMVQLVLVDRMNVGTSVITDLAMPALPERYLGAQGLIGIDALTDQRLMMDFEQKTITVQDSRTQAPTLDGDIVVTARRERGQLILTQVVIGGRGIFAVIDTGSDLTIGNMTLKKRIFGSREPPSTPVKVMSVTGQQLVANLVTLPELRIGGMTLSNVQVAFVDAAPFALFGLSRQPALLLGTDVLQSFKRLSLDFRRRKVRFSLRRKG